jgi:hypothetical protein
MADLPVVVDMRECCWECGKFRIPVPVTWSDQFRHLCPLCERVVDVRMRARELARVLLVSSSQRPRT